MHPEIDHRTALRSLDADERQALTARSDAPALRRLAGHLGMLSLTGTGIVLAAPSVTLTIVAMFLHGVVLVFLFAPLHETAHRTAFRTRALNDAVAHACGFLLLLPRDYFEAFHLTHHRHTQDPARDPELSVPKPVGIVAYLWHLSGWPYWQAQAQALLHTALNRPPFPFVPNGAWPRLVRQARLYTAAYTAVAALSFITGSTAALAYWIVPALLGQPVLRAYLLAEHAACPLVPDMLRNSRTTRASGLVRFLAWNMPYHAEHHAMPGVPFHNLPRLHARLAPHLGRTAEGYPQAHAQILRDQVLRKA